MQRHNHRNRKDQKKRAKARKEAAKKKAPPPVRQILDMRNTFASHTDPHYGGRPANRAPK